MARANSTLIITEGPAGSGKTLCRAGYFVPEFLREVKATADRPALHISNFPLLVEDWTDDDGKERKGLASLCESRYSVPADQVRERVALLDEEELKRWATFESGPWDYFAETELSACHIAIDEAHNYIPADAPAKHRRRWQTWLGEIRHKGATIELLSQDASKISKEVLKEAGMKISLMNGENIRDPLLRILVSDWLELIAGFVTGRYDSFCLESESIKVHGKWKTQQTRSRPMVPAYFDVYNSYSAPQAGGAGGRAVQRAYKSHSKLGLLVWFWRRNWWPLTWANLAVCLVVWLCFLGGGAMIFREVLNVFNEASSKMIAKNIGGDAKGRGARAVESPIEIARDRIAELPPDVQAAVTPELRTELLAVYQKIDELTARVHQEEGLRIEVQQRLQEVENKIGLAFEISALERDRVIFREGDSYGIGDTIEFGPYEGASVESIDWNRRAVHLSGGKRLRMAAGSADRDRVQTSSMVAPEPEPAGVGLQGSIRTPGVDYANGNETGRGGANRNDFFAGDAAKPVRSVVVERNGGFDRGRERTRPFAGDSGHSGRDGNANAPSGGASSGSGSQPGGSPVFRGDFAPPGSRGVSAQSEAVKRY